MCSGFANLYAAMCTLVGIKVWVIRGTAAAVNLRGPHAWNCVQLDGQLVRMLALLVTWDKAEFFCDSISSILAGPVDATTRRQVARVCHLTLSGGAWSQIPF
jgi:hypothetical protein